ncbi:bisphosphoglycerate mutase isoform X2 [Macaca fascicularis]|uniref:bisphosphoglycerate mutase isoform X2 n=1 Tax=Macaca fascicularis TaxID=9541 RepID=UPI003D15BED4
MPAAVMSPRRRWLFGCSEERLLLLLLLVAPLQVSQMKTSSTLLFLLESPFFWNWMKTCVLLGLISSWVTKRRSKQPLRK